MAEEIVLTKYKIKCLDAEIPVKIVRKRKEVIVNYFLELPKLGLGTKALMEKIKENIIAALPVGIERILDIHYFEKVKRRIVSLTKEALEKEELKISEHEKNLLIAYLANELLGIGLLEFLLSDPYLEEIVINSSREPIWVFHKNFGWLKTNITIPSEEQIQNYASIIARRVGKQISVLNPLLDAHIITGDRANATLFPISSFGNTITIRRFRRQPWTATDFIRNNTVSSEAMAFIWQAFQYELSVIISGGTASGKTTMLNVCMPFIQNNHRIITIEETRELMLPRFLHWVPLTTREPNPEGKGGITMLDLLVNALRMRPDRLVVGEVRREREVEVLFEAMLTGHSGYTTVHANTAEQTIRRIITPPMSLPPSILSAAHLNVVMFRNRRTGRRYVLEIAEYIPERRGVTEETVSANILYRYKPTIDKVVKQNNSIRIVDELSALTGLSPKELQEDLREKQKILEWMLKQNISSLEDIGKVVNSYYLDRDYILNLVKKNKPFKV